MYVERAGEGDIKELTELRTAYLQEDLGEMSESDRAALEERLPDYFRRHLGRDLTAYLVREGGRIAACALLLVTESPMSPAFLNGMTGTVFNVYTRPASRKKGFAGNIMRAMLSDAKESGICRIELKSTDAGQDLYRSVGFEDDPGEYHLMRWLNREKPLAKD